MFDSPNSSVAKEDSPEFNTFHLFVNQVHQGTGLGIITDRDENTERTFESARDFRGPPTLREIKPTEIQES